MAMSKCSGCVCNTCWIRPTCGMYSAAASCAGSTTECSVCHGECLNPCPCGCPGCVCAVSPACTSTECPPETRQECPLFNPERAPQYAPSAPPYAPPAPPYAPSAPPYHCPPQYSQCPPQYVEVAPPYPPQMHPLHYTTSIHYTELVPQYTEPMDNEQVRPDCPPPQYSEAPPQYTEYAHAQYPCGATYVCHVYSMLTEIYTYLVPATIGSTGN